MFILQIGKINVKTNSIRLILTVLVFVLLIVKMYIKTSIIKLILPVLMLTLTLIKMYIKAVTNKLILTFSLYIFQIGKLTELGKYDSFIVHFANLKKVH